MSIDRDDLRHLFAKARAANLVGIPPAMELIKLEEHFLKVLPEGWDRETLGSAFYAHCKTARGKFWFHPHELVDALTSESLHGRGGNWDGVAVNQGCELCQKFGSGEGLLWVAKAEPSKRPHSGGLAAPRIVSGVLRCYCNPYKGEETNAREWLEGWWEHQKWHRDGITAITNERVRDGEWAVYDQQRQLADTLMGPT